MNAIISRFFAQITALLENKEYKKAFKTPKYNPFTELQEMLWMLWIVR